MSEISEAQLNANRENAQLSRGPITEDGKARSSRNSYKHGLTGRKIFLEGENLEAYQALVQSFLDHYQPQNIEERALVQIIADCHWRIDRAVSIEEQAKCELTLERLERASLTNLTLYVSRIDRMRQKATQELQQLQAARKAEEQRQLEEAIKLARYRKMRNEPFDPQENGFVFSATEIDMAGNDGTRRARPLRSPRMAPPLSAFACLAGEPLRAR